MTTMLTQEETNVLGYLGKHRSATVDELAKSCGTSTELLTRLLPNMEWFGHVIVLHDPNAMTTAVQITEMGMKHALRPINSK